MKKNRISTKGQVIVIIALVLVVLLALAGLAIDIGMAYGVKAKLNAAVDAAAIAACREITSATGTDTSAKAVAKNFFHANFPNGYLGATPPDPTTIIDTSNPSGSTVVRVTATAASPTYFARVVGWKNFNVGALAEATKPSLDLALVLDTTSSLSGVFGTVQARAIDFTNRFNANNDRLALVPFATGVGLNVVNGELVLTDGVEINKSVRGFSKQAVSTAINRLAAGGNTASEFGIRMGMYQLNKVTTPAANRVIVFFSDGAPNTFTGIFPLTPSGNSTVSGNLFSETWNPGPPHTLFHPNVRDDSNNAQSISLYKVPANGGGNFIGTVQILPQVAVSGKRTITGYTNSNPAGLKCDANKAARNMLENIASLARSQGIAVYSLGYGDLLDQQDITNDCTTSTELGSTIMKRVANTADSDSHNSTQPTGIYCHALTTNDLGPCFDAIANAILRLSK